MTVAFLRTSAPAQQGHDYISNPTSGVTFTFASGTLKTAALNTKSALAPSGINVAYTATTAVTRTPCTVIGGSSGDELQTTGTLEFTSYKLVTPTSPIFGTVTKKATKATLADDPGCAPTGDVTLNQTATLVVRTYTS